MLKETFALSLFTVSLFAIAFDNTSTEILEENLDEIEETQELPRFEEEELSILHKKGHRPQVIEIPTKTVLVH